MHRIIGVIALLLAGCAREPDSAVYTNVASGCLVYIDGVATRWDRNRYGDCQLGDALASNQRIETLLRNLVDASIEARVKDVISTMDFRSYCEPPEPNQKRYTCDVTAKVILSDHRPN